MRSKILSMKQNNGFQKKSHGVILNSIYMVRIVKSPPYKLNYL